METTQKQEILNDIKTLCKYEDNSYDTVINLFIDYTEKELINKIHRVYNHSIMKHIITQMALYKVFKNDLHSATNYGVISNDNGQMINLYIADYPKELTKEINSLKRNVWLR